MKLATQFDVLLDAVSGRKDGIEDAMRDLLDQVRKTQALVDTVLIEHREHSLYGPSTCRYNACQLAAMM